MSYHEELAAHLASQAHPKQGTGLTTDGQRLVRPPVQVVPDPLEQEMAEMRARLAQRQAELEKIMGPKPQGPENSTFGPVIRVSMRGLVLIASVATVVGLVVWGLA